MATSTLRKSRGIPTGGQFDFHPRVDAEVTLTAPRRVSATTDLTDAEALRIARIQAFNARGWRGGTVVETDDIAQEALLSVLTSQYHGTVYGFTPGLLTSAARNAVSASINTGTGMRYEDAQALKKLNAVREEFEHFEHRHLTEAELDVLAADIREEWPNPRHRPIKGFNHRRLVTASADEDDSLLRDIASPVYERPDGDECGMDLADAVETGKMSKEDARLRLWNTLAESSENKQLPLVLRGSLPERQAKWVKRAVKESGGVGTLAQAQLAGNTPDGSPLFTPFGRPSPRERDRIAKFLLDRPAVADRLWASALAGAEK